MIENLISVFMKYDNLLLKTYLIVRYFTKNIDDTTLNHKFVPSQLRNIHLTQKQVKY